MKTLFIALLALLLPLVISIFYRAIQVTPPPEKPPPKVGVLPELYPAMRSFEATSLQVSNPDPVCLKAYEDFYQEPVTTVRLVFGYKDARPARFVGDRYEHATFVQTLIEPCAPNFYACGFLRDGEDAHLFSKEIILPNGTKKVLRLFVIHSSVGPDDDENRIDNFQHWQTQYVQEHFLEGLKTSSAVFYNGHSRLGGGPDFGPPKLGAKQHVDYGWYQKNSPGLTSLLETLRIGNAHLMLLGLFSCVSSGLFAERILAEKSLGLVTSSVLLYYIDAYKNLLGTISSLAGMACEEDFQWSVQARVPQKSSELKAFFKK